LSKDKILYGRGKQRRKEGETFGLGGGEEGGREERIGGKSGERKC